MGVTGILTACHYHASSFLVPAIASCLLYVGGVAGVLLKPWLRIDGLAWGLLSGSVLQVAVLLKGIDRRAFAAPLFGCEPMLRFSSRAAAILMVTAVSPMYAILDRAFASGLVPGTVGAVTMAVNVVTMPSSLIVMSLNSALLPGLVLLSERRSAFAQVVRWAIIYMAFLLLPATLIMLWWSGPIMRLLLQSRQFDANAAVVAGSLLAAYSFSMVGIGLKDVLSNALIGLGRERVALTAGLVSLAASVALKWCYLAHSGTVWIALSTSASAWIATAILIVVFSRMVPIAWLTIWTKEGWRILADCVILSAVCYMLAGWVTTGPVWATAAGTCGTGLVYFSAARVLRLSITNLRDPRPFEGADIVAEEATY
jgi:putative peptidoglycan lipid II flippase